ncbi:MAG: hypothetical protein EGQ60_00420 [Clostridiales bacterium]|jgi:hypothetical protein|nr:hypothetical protein [Clostridiales bacterium]MBS4878847.1 hypothetical protein [Bacillota bacterium]DAH05878.1 MAG TPA: hypothetical protein [Caudoviricetes sp.]
MNETKGNIRWAEKFCTDERERALARLSRKKIINLSAEIGNLLMKENGLSVAQARFILAITGDRLLVFSRQVSSSELD